MKPLMKLLIGITFGILLGASVDAAVGTFTFKTPRASDTVEAVSLVYPQRVPEAGSVTNDKLAEPISVANGGTGATSAATGLAALGGATLNGNIAVPFSTSTINGVAPLTAGEKTQALVGSSTVDFAAKSITSGGKVLGGMTTSVGAYNLQIKGFRYRTMVASGSADKVTVAEACLSIAAGTIVALSTILPPPVNTANPIGRLEAIDTTGGSIAGFAIRGASDVTAEAYDSGVLFTPTFNNAATINICHLAASDTYVIQNNTTITRVLYFNYIGN